MNCFCFRRFHFRWVRTLSRGTVRSPSFSLLGFRSASFDLRPGGLRWSFRVRSPENHLLSVSVGRVERVTEAPYALFALSAICGRPNVFLNDPVPRRPI